MLYICCVSKTLRHVPVQLCKLRLHCPNMELSWDCLHFYGYFIRYSTTYALGTYKMHLVQSLLLQSYYVCDLAHDCEHVLRLAWLQRGGISDFKTVDRASRQSRELAALTCWYVLEWMERPPLPLPPPLPFSLPHKSTKQLVTLCVVYWHKTSHAQP